MLSVLAIKGMAGDLRGRIGRIGRSPKGDSCFDS